MSYQLQANESVLRLVDNTSIPANPANRDYAEYQAWIAAGNKPLPAPPRPTLPVSTPAQKLEALGLTVAELRGLLGIGQPPTP